MESCVLRLSLVVSVLLAATAAAFAGTVTINRTSYNFGMETVGLQSRPAVIQVTNGSSNAITVTSISLTGAGFQLTQGVSPVTLPKNTATTWTILFAPTTTGTLKGTFTVTVSSQQQPFTVSLTGVGTTTTAIATPSPTSVPFAAMQQGQVASQLLTITNTGSTRFDIRSIIVDPPFYTDPVPQTMLNPGASYSFNVYFSPAGVGTFSDNLILDFDTLPDQIVPLTGTATAPTTLTISSFSLSTAPTQGAAYNALLSAASGKPPYTWQVQSGSSLPAGLTVSSSGTISGAVASSVQPGTYSTVFQVTDSSVPPFTASKTILFPVGAPTGGNCNNIVANGTDGNALTPLDVLGTGNYFGSLGGLYDNGSNQRPSDHDAAGVSIAQDIVALDANGNPDPNGTKVFLILGESNVEIEAEGIVRDAMLDPTRDSHVVVVNGAMGNETASNLKSPTSAYWTSVLNYLLPNAGVTPQQVVAIWAEPNDVLNMGTYPTDISPLESEITSEVQNFLIKFPNVKLAYLSSRTYSGYSVTTVNPEPYAYEAAFAVRSVISDQLSGDPALNFDPAKGTVMAPWLSWGPYYWTNGLTVASKSGVRWSCQDSQADGAHPSRTVAEQKVASRVLKMLQTDDTAGPWYLAAPKK